MPLTNKGEPAPILFAIRNDTGNIFRPENRFSPPPPVLFGSTAPLTISEGGACSLWLLCQHQARAWSLASCYSVKFGESFLSKPRAPSCFPHHHHAAARRCSRREDGRGVGAPCHCPLLSAPLLPSLWLLPAASLQLLLLQEHVSSRSHFPSSLSTVKKPRFGRDKRSEELHWNWVSFSGFVHVAG